MQTRAKSDIPQLRDAVQKRAVPNEEVAYRLVGLYFQEIARSGFKRRLNLDAMINAYLYTLKRLENKQQEIGPIERAVCSEEEVLAKESKEELFPVPGN